MSVTYHVKSLNDIVKVFRERSKNCYNLANNYSKTLKEKEKNHAIAYAWENAANILENTVIDSENEKEISDNNNEISS